MFQRLLLVNSKELKVMDKFISYAVVVFVSIVVGLFTTIFVYGNILLTLGVGISTNASGFGLLAVNLAGVMDLVAVLFSLILSVGYFPKALSNVSRDIRNRRSKKKN